MELFLVRFLFVLPLIFTGALLYRVYRRDTRSLWYGGLALATVFSAGLTAFMLLAVAGEYIPAAVMSLLAVLAVLLFIPISLFVPSIILALIGSGRKLIRREGRSWPHLLSIGLGVAVFAYTLFWPAVANVTDNPYYQSLITFVSAVLWYLVVVAACFLVSSYLNRRLKRGVTYDYIIVLGSGLIGGDTVSPLLGARIEKGMQVLSEQGTKEAKIIFSGGRGNDETVSEAEAMAAYAHAKGLAHTKSMLEDASVSTEQNLLFSQKLIATNWPAKSSRVPKIALVTSNFHVFRALLLARREGVYCQGAGAPVKFYYWLNALIREYVAVLDLTKKTHFVVLGLIGALTLLLLAIRLQMQ